MGFAYKNIKRMPLKTVLIAAVAMFFTLTSCWMGYMINHYEDEIDHLYATVKVKAEIVQDSAIPILSDGVSGFIKKDEIDTIISSGFVYNTRLLTGHAWKVRDINSNEQIIRRITLHVLDNSEAFRSNTWLKDIIINYAEGWDEGIFTADYTDIRTIPVIMNSEMIEEYGLQFGDTVVILAEQLVEYPKRIQIVVVGEYFYDDFRAISVTSNEVYPVLFPLGGLVQQTHSTMGYMEAEFIIDPAYNRDLQTAREFIDSIVKRTYAGKAPVHVRYWDEELQQAITPMERVLSLLSILLPITIAVSAVTAAGMAVLLTLQKSKEAAILRALGIPKRHTRMILCCEHLIVCILGLLIGLVVSVFIFNGDLDVFMGKSLLQACLYLLSALIGTALTTIKITDRMPMELLQAKE